MYLHIISVGGWCSLTQSLGLCFTVLLWTIQKFAILYIETSKCFAIAHLDFLLLIHSCSESSKPLCDGCHQWIAQRRGRYLSWELGRELPASLPPSTWYWYQWRKNTITTAKTKTNKHKNKKQRYWQRQRHSDLAPRAIDQTSVDCQLPVEQMFHLTFEKFLKIHLHKCWSQGAWTRNYAFFVSYVKLDQSIQFHLSFLNHYYLKHVANNSLKHNITYMSSLTTKEGKVKKAAVPPDSD